VDGKGSRPFRRRPWQAVAASEMAGSWGERQRVRASDGVRARFVRETRGRRRERHLDARETPETPRLLMRRHTCPIGQRFAVERRLLYTQVKLHRATWTPGPRTLRRDVSVTFPASPCRLSPERAVPAPALPQNLGTRRFGGGHSLPGSPPKRPGLSPRPQRPGPSPVPRGPGPNPHPSRRTREPFPSRPPAEASTTPDRRARALAPARSP
jgi:hypothetical protein